ncbi:uncharacterized protein N7484_000645 [Penicillium longicatenatum]|uniref:uncharacterized protein n=1 Tax=Penicillium longicatenatum TaxID=1561947 RepID=UPI0025493428|nr:uncharacterized protein N7484_000645 [Penicillium longicatenatum]KAJ5661273.1 hypothetical protein N7484_000645 [Penicillium longicatenatum]
MTAVVSPPSVQSGSRLGWYSTGNGGQGALSSVDDEVSRMFMQRKPVQRSNSSSSLGSNTSTTTVITTQDPNAGQGSTSDGTWSSKKKPARSPWPSSKSEPVAGVTNTRSQAVPAFLSGPTASSTMSAIHQPQSIVPSQHMLQSSQQNGIRQQPNGSAEPPAILGLVPMNGTFEKKQINVPFYPEVLRIGRQTNAKTVPTPVNGFFDSKVLSRQHAEIWADKTGKIWIRDVKSSNGTFVNGHRLSPENRESEPHELRENDTLELGIDIVSEDQNSIVHHKVSAKVEHAGLYGSTPNILDLNFGDLDPASGGGLLPSPLSQPLSHLRGRSGSNASNRSAQSAASSQLNALHQQRQMNYWNSPISVEQVVKRLTGELKQAKQQSMDLRQTDEFLTAIMKPGYAEKEKASKPSSFESNGPRQLNGRPKMPRVDSFSRFSDPPAPPPQQPLPEKPDAPLRNASDSFSPLKRSDTEKTKPATSSPVSRDSSQILNLIEALSSAKREIDTQGARVKELETLVLQERAARESAEEKVRSLEMHLTPQTNGVTKSEDSLAEQESAIKDELEDSEEAQLPNGSVLPSEASSAPDVHLPEPTTVDTTQLEHRLETMMQEMEEMRKQMASFKERAEKAEEENVESRASLAEMIETLRRERAEKVLVSKPGSKSDPQGNDQSKTTTAQAHLIENGAVDPDKKSGSSVQPLDPASADAKEMDAAATAMATEWRRRQFLHDTSPYASMVGVVLLGVGIMAYLNGWQKLDK